MKLSAALILAASAGAASAASRKAIDVSASHKVSGAAARKLIRASRKLEDENNNNNNNNQDEDEFSFLINYRMKFVQCVPTTRSPARTPTESSAVIYRLCPSDVESESAFGCTDDEAYGDYVVGINTYTQAIAENMEQEAENNGNNNNNNDEFNLEEYAECREADMNMEQDQDEGRRLADRPAGLLHRSQVHRHHGQQGQERRRFRHWCE